MLEWLVTAGYIVICIALFSLAIAIHEFGHVIVALKLGLKVERFSIGFGPALWKRTFRGVEYRISAIPLGGYVMIPDVDPEGTKAVQGEGGGRRAEIPPWKEIAVAFAGPAMNIVLAVVLAFVLAAVPSANFGVLGTEIGSVVPGGPADRAGMKAGDKVRFRPVSAAAAQSVYRRQRKMLEDLEKRLALPEPEPEPLEPVQGRFLVYVNEKEYDIYVEEQNSDA